MPVTLAQAKLNATDDIDVNIIDEFRKQSVILDALTFDDAVSPAGGGATLTYGYQRQVSQRAAAFRAINAEYTPTEVTKQRYTVDLKPLGGSFQIDRVLAGIARGAEVSFQLRELVKATRTEFQDECINGDTAVDANGFDGLNKSLTGSTTEYKPLSNGVSVGYLDMTAAGIDTDTERWALLDHVDAMIDLMDGLPTMLLMNRRLKARMRSLARAAHFWTEDRNEFGQLVETYRGIPMTDPGEQAGSTNPIIEVASRDADEGGAGGAIANLTDLYAVRFGLDAFHGVSVAGGQLVRTWLPDFERAGAVKTGEAEMGPVAVALKRTKSAAVLRNIKVA